MKEPPPAPLANDFQVIARFDNDPDPVTGERKGFTDAPSLVRAGDGSLLCAIPWSRKGKTVTRGEGSLSFHRSRDEGLTWERIDTCPGHGAWSLSVAAVCSVGDEDRRLTYRFHNFRPLPGAYNHFHIRLAEPFPFDNRGSP